MHAFSVSFWLARLLRSLAGQQLSEILAEILVRSWLTIYLYCEERHKILVTFDAVNLLIQKIHLYDRR